MFSRILLVAMMTFGLVATPVTEARAEEKVLASGACALAIAATALAMCKFGASVEGAECRNSGLDQVRRKCGKLKECKGDCKDAYKTLKKTAKLSHKACKKDCKTVKGAIKRLKCKRACGKAKRATLKKKKQARSTCKKTCKKNYRSGECVKARAKLVAWATAAGGSFAAIVKACGRAKR